jgi:enolase
MSTGVGDEGGFAPDLKSNEDALKFVMQAIEARRATSPARTCDCPRLRPAASSGRTKQRTCWRAPATPDQRRDGGAVGRLVQALPDLLSIEDGMAEDDWAAGSC